MRARVCNVRCGHYQHVSVCEHRRTANSTEHTRARALHNTLDAERPDDFQTDQTTIMESDRNQKRHRALTRIHKGRERPDPVLQSRRDSELTVERLGACSVRSREANGPLLCA